MEYYSALKRNEILHILKHRWKTGRHHTPWKKPDTEGEVWFYFHEVPKIVKFRETEYRSEVRGYQGLGGGDNEDLVSDAYRAFVWEDEKGVQMDSGDGYSML